MVHSISVNEDEGCSTHFFFLTHILLMLPYQSHKLVKKHDLSKAFFPIYFKVMAYGKDMPSPYVQCRSNLWDHQDPENKGAIWLNKHCVIFTILSQPPDMQNCSIQLNGPSLQFSAQPGGQKQCCAGITHHKVKNGKFQIFFPGYAQNKSCKAKAIF